jgi:ribosomal protein L37AE/L43A
VTYQGGRTVPKINDDATFPIPCPSCKHEMEQRFGILRANPILTCPACGHRFAVQGDGPVVDVVTDSEELNRLLDDPEQR